MKNGKEYEKRGRIRNGKMGFGEKQDFFGEGYGNDFNIWATKNAKKRGTTQKVSFVNTPINRKYLL